MITVVNKKYHTPTPQDFYCGRGSPLGNPEPIRPGFSREQAIAFYKPYLSEKIRNKDSKVCGELNRIYRAAKVGNVNLVCFCVPEDCHANYIKKLIEEKL